MTPRCAFTSPARGQCKRWAMRGAATCAHHAPDALEARVVELVGQRDALDREIAAMRRHIPILRRA